MTVISARLHELQIPLPDTPIPVESYAPYFRFGKFFQTSGQLPMTSGRPLCDAYVRSQTQERKIRRTRMALQTAPYVENPEQLGVRMGARRG